MDHASQLDRRPGEVWLEIVVPARNEEARLRTGLTLLCAKAATLPPGVAIIVVDSASTDETAEIVRTWPTGPVPVRLIRCQRPGKGAAVRAGLLATDADLVGFCDADMATDLAALDLALELLSAGRPLVIGSRAHPDSTVEVRHSHVRRFGAAIFRSAARTVATGVSDTQCGFKFFSGPVARAAAEHLRAAGFAFDIELIGLCSKLSGQRPVEIPVVWRDMAGSTFSVRRHALAAFWELGRIWLALHRPGRLLGVRSNAAAAGMAGKQVAVINWRDPWHPQAGGAERYAWEMAQGMLRRGAFVRYITARAPGQQRRESRDGIEVVRMGGRWTVYPQVLAWLALRRRAIDAVIDCQNGIPFFAPWVLPRRCGVLCVVHHVHDAQFGVHFPPLVAAIGRVLEGPVARLCYRRRACVAVSHSTAAAMRARLGWRGPIYVIPNGVSADCFAVPDDAERAVVNADGPVLISMVGRLVAHKRTERVLEIAERLRYRPATIDVIGRGPQTDSLEREIAARGLLDVVRLRGFLPEADKRAAVAASALHVSTSQGEGWGLCVLEAAALGVPTVAYDVDGLRDAVRDNETGWLVKDGERIEDVTERALKELTDPKRREQIGAACRSWAAKFVWDRSAEYMAGLLTAGPECMVDSSGPAGLEASAFAALAEPAEPALLATSQFYCLDGAQSTG